MKLEESTFLTSDYTTKLQSSRQYGIGTKTETQTNGIREKAQKLTHAPIGTLFFDKTNKNMHWDNDSLFNKWCWGNWTASCKRMKLEHFLTPYTKINSKWIKDLNVSPETIKLLQGNIGRTLDNINQRKILYDPLPRVMGIKTKLNKWYLIKLKNFCTAKETISKVKNTALRMEENNSK